MSIISKEPTAKNRLVENLSGKFAKKIASVSLQMSLVYMRQ